MNIPRNVTNIINYILDNLIPPILRDQKWFMWLPFKIIFKNKEHFFFNFKDFLHDFSDKQIIQIYKSTKDVHIKRSTDLNNGCLKKILSEVTGESVLDVGCGSGYLTNILEKEYKVTSSDFIKDINFKTKNSTTKFIQSDASSLPFEDKSFDTVICTHTLEHIKEINSAIIELKRVCKQKLIVVVPKQRPYKYTFDLHVHFFPYEFIFLNLIVETGKRFKKRNIQTIQGDIYYHEEY